MVRIAVEQPLIDVKMALNKAGYEAEMLERKVDASSYDCVVVRGMEDLDDLHMNVPIVEARGRSVDEIVEKVEDHLQRAGVIEEVQRSGGSSSSKFGMGMAMGTIVGATVGFLLAPKPGKELRQDLNTKMQETKEQSSGLTNKVKGQKDSLMEKTNMVKDKATQMRDKVKDKAGSMKNKNQNNNSGSQNSGQNEEEVVVRSTVAVAEKENGETAAIKATEVDTPKQ